MTKQTIIEKYEEKFPEIMGKHKVKAFPREAYLDLKKDLSEALDQVERETIEEISYHIFGEFNRSELKAVSDSMARAVGHTYSAINGVKNSENAILVLAHNSQRQEVDLPKEKTITLEDIKFGKLRGSGKAIVLDNYAVYEITRDLHERFKRFFDSLKSKYTTSGEEKE